MRKINPLHLGHTAERRAARFLRRAGLVVVERNVIVGGGEIDLVLVDGDVVVFCEVRRRSDGIGAAADSVTHEKKRILRRAVRAYRSRERLWAVPVRGDVVVVDGRRRSNPVHLRGAFDVD